MYRAWEGSVRTQPQLCVANFASPFQLDGDETSSFLFLFQKSIQYLVSIGDSMRRHALLLGTTQ